MDKKYIGKHVALPKDTADKLEAVRAEISAELGFALSLAEAISYLCKEHEDMKNERSRSVRV